jgi:hypothetical protein
MSDQAKNVAAESVPEELATDDLKNANGGVRVPIETTPGLPSPVPDPEI